MKFTFMVIILVLVLASPTASAQPADWLLVTPHVVKIAEMVAIDVYGVLVGVQNQSRFLQTSIGALVLGGVVGGPSMFLLAALARDDAEAVRDWRIVSFLSDMVFAIGFAVVSVGLADALWVDNRYGSKASLFGVGLTVSITFSLTSVLDLLLDRIPFSIEKAAASSS